MYAQIWRHTVSFTCLAHGSIMPTLNTIFPKNYPTIKSLRLNMRSLSLFKARGNEHRPLEKKRTKKINENSGQCPNAKHWTVHARAKNTKKDRT